MKPKFRFPQEAQLIAAKDIDLDGRSRRDYGDLQDLASSISEHGLIHPPTLTKNGNKLIAGGRRIASMVGPLECTEIPVVYREHMPQHQLRELELHENAKRLGMKWQESVLLIYNIHKLKKRAAIARDSTWYARETGELVGKSGAHVSHALLVAKVLLAGDEEIEKCESLVKAVQILLKRKADEAIAFKSKQTGALVNPKKQQGGGIVEVDLEGGESVVQDGSAAPAEGTITTTNVEFDLAEFMFGDSMELMKNLPDGSVDHVITDPPYGIDMKNLDTFKNIASVEDTHDVDQNVSMFRPFLEQAFRVIKTGYCVFWYDISHHEKLQQIATDVGFKAQRWPIEWIKTHPCRNSSAEFNFTKSTEYAMVCRKGDAVLQKPATKNWIMADGSAETRKYDHPFVKPFDVWSFILEHVAYRGQRILDPYAGQMSGPRAFINHGMIPVAMEIDPTHYVKGVEAVKKLVSAVTGGGATFKNDNTAEVAELIIETATQPAETETPDVEF